jgi:hypothetical protein
MTREINQTKVVEIDYENFREKWILNNVAFGGLGTNPFGQKTLEGL